MGNLRACFAVAMLALAACGSNEAKPDALIIIPDAAIDAKVWMDAPPPTADLSCLNMAAPTTAPANITIAGSTSTLSMGGGSALASVAVDVFEVGNPTALASVTSNASGAFTTGNIPTGGEPINGYVRAVPPPPANQGDDTYRSTYTYPGTVVATNLTGVPIVHVSTTTFGMLESFSGVDQDDSQNGALIVLALDCAGEAIDGATVSVQQNNADVGTIFDLGALVPQAAGTFFVFNVPDGEAQVKMSLNGMAFPTRTVSAYQAQTKGGPGTMTNVQVTPRN
jgi:hypothetical protein